MSRLSIKHKFFFAFVISSLLVIFLILFFVRLGFQKGFHDYLQSTQLEKIQPLAEVLAEQYELEGSDWSFLQRNPKRFRDIIRNTPELSYLLPRVESPHGRRSHRTKLRKLEATNPLKISDQRQISILDTDKRLIFGPKRQKTKLNLLPIESNGSPIGYLGLPKIGKIYQKSVLQFFRKQNRNFMLIAVIAVVVALICSWLLTWHFLSPIKRLTDHSKQLMAKNFGHRINQFSRDELGNLAKEMNSLAQSLEKNESVRQRWIADISHELRTPLSVLQGEIEAMLDGIRPMNESSVESLQDEARQLKRLVEDLYELSLSDAGALNYQKESLNVVELIEESLQSFQSLFDSHQMGLEFNNQLAKQEQLLLDPNRFKQLMTNLYKNSVKYTEKPGTLALSVKSEEQDIVITLEDSKPGVPARSLNTLFDRFYREESSRNRKTGGAGLGLAICKNIVEAHNGTIEAKDSSLGGLKIEITFPLL